jgi:hypothetical protein
MKKLRTSLWPVSCQLSLSPVWILIKFSMGDCWKVSLLFGRLLEDVISCCTYVVMSTANLRVSRRIKLLEFSLSYLPVCWNASIQQNILNVLAYIHVWNLGFSLRRVSVCQYDCHHYNKLINYTFSVFPKCVACRLSHFGNLSCRLGIGDWQYWQFCLITLAKDSICWKDP